MLHRSARKLYAGLVGILTCSLLLAFVSAGHASQDELDKVKSDIWAKGKHWVAEETEVSKLPDHERKMRLGLLKPQAPDTEAAAPSVSADLTGRCAREFRLEKQ